MNKVPTGHKFNDGIRFTTSRTHAGQSQTVTTSHNESQPCTILVVSRQQYNHQHPLHVRCDWGLLFNYYKWIKSPRITNLMMVYVLPQVGRMQASHKRSQRVTTSHNLAQCAEHGITDTSPHFFTNQDVGSWLPPNPTCEARFFQSSCKDSIQTLMAMAMCSPQEPVKIDFSRRINWKKKKEES